MLHKRNYFEREISRDSIMPKKNNIVSKTKTLINKDELIL